VPAASGPAAPTLRTLVVLLLSAVMLSPPTRCTCRCPRSTTAFAEKGVEMSERGPGWTVTWKRPADVPESAAAVLAAGRRVRAVGENDFAARLPSIVLALGLGAPDVADRTHRARSTRRLDAAALLLVTPLFLNHARRTMLDLPFAFWSAALLWIALEGIERPRRLVLLAVPLGAALLTRACSRWSRSPPCSDRARPAGRARALRTPWP
jgi:hypothetical protein